MAVAHLDVADFVLIAAEALDLDVDQVFRDTALGIAETALERPGLVIAGAEVYGPLAMKAAVLYATLTRYRPLVGHSDADQRVVAFLCMVEFIERNGHDLDLDPDLAEQLVGVATGVVADTDFARWLEPRMHRAAS